MALAGSWDTLVAEAANSNTSSFFSAALTLTTGDDDDPKDCVHWINSYFGQCVEGDRQITGFFFGLSSIAVWLLAQAPSVG